MASMLALEPPEVMAVTVVLVADIMQHGAGNGAVAVCQINDGHDIPRMHGHIVAQMKDHQKPSVFPPNHPEKQGKSAHFLSILVYQILRIFSNADQHFLLIFTV